MTLTTEKPSASQALTSRSSGQWSNRVLLLSAVHPDFVPPLYAMACALRDLGYEAHIFSYSSLSGGTVSLGDHVVLHDCGNTGGSFNSRTEARRRFRRHLAEWVEKNDFTGVVSLCPFSYLEALRIANGRPIAYHSIELYSRDLWSLRGSPMTAIRNTWARRRLHAAALISTPSAERSGWLMGRAHLAKLPVTIMNAPYVANSANAPSSSGSLLPARIRAGHVVIHTGGVSRTQCLHELVASVEHWPEDARLVVTNVRDGPYVDALRAAAARSNRTEDIVLLPTVTRSEMIALQNRASVGVCLLRPDVISTQLPAPTKVGEYLHAGLVVVGFRMPYLDRLARFGVLELAEMNEPLAIADAVARALRRAAEPGTRTAIDEVVQSWYNMTVQIRPIADMLSAAQPAHA